MPALTGAAAVVFAVSASAIFLFFVLYPAAMLVASLFARSARLASADRLPSMRLLVIVRNAGSFIESKVANTLALDYPPEKFDALFYSDGSTDDTNRILRSHEGPRLRVLIGSEHEGKIACLNRAMEGCTTEVVVFSDADALLAPDALLQLARHLGDGAVGGVCGRRIIAEERAGLRDVQAHYLSFDTAIKSSETRLGSVTSNDGKLYCIRRELFQPVAPGVTDDAFVAYNVVRQRRRFVFEPDAMAHVPVPSRTLAHEVRRRRRIVSQSLRGIFLMREVLNPFSFGWFSIGLAVNKVLRRGLPLCLLAAFVSSGLLSLRVRWMAFVWLLQAVFYLLAASYAILSRLTRSGALRRSAELACYIVVGQYGTLLGLVDFLRGRSVARWDPVKTDASAG